MYLLFKEASTTRPGTPACSRVEVEIEAGADVFLLRVRDDGRGFDTASAREGHGLKTMSQRARDLGGRAEIVSASGQGTVLSAELPFTRPAKRPWS